MNYPPRIPIDDSELHAIVPPRYEWDAWDPYAAIGDIDWRTEALLRAMSDRAKLAFSIACAEWVVGRLQPWLNGDVTAWQFIEACWAFEMCIDIALPHESRESEWQGQIRAPVDLSLMTILNTAIGFEDDNAEVDAAFAEKLALHVLVDRRPFLHWRRLVLRRLRRSYPFDDVDRLGRPVPREALMIRNSAGELPGAEAVTAFLARTHTP
jgi:hypothetical protein